MISSLLDDGWHDTVVRFEDANSDSPPAEVRTVAALLRCYSRYFRVRIDRAIAAAEDGTGSPMSFPICLREVFDDPAAAELALCLMHNGYGAVDAHDVARGSTCVMLMRALVASDYFGIDRGVEGAICAMQALTVQKLKEQAGGDGTALLDAYARVPGHVRSMPGFQRFSVTLANAVHAFVRDGTMQIARLPPSELLIDVFVAHHTAQYGGVGGDDNDDEEEEADDDDDSSSDDQNMMPAYGAQNRQAVDLDVDAARLAAAVAACDSPAKIDNLVRAHRVRGVSWDSRDNMGPQLCAAVSARLGTLLGRLSTALREHVTKCEPKQPKHVAQPTIQAVMALCSASFVLLLCSEALEVESEDCLLYAIDMYRSKSKSSLASVLDDALKAIDLERIAPRHLIAAVQRFGTLSRVMDVAVRRMMPGFEPSRPPRAMSPTEASSLSVCHRVVVEEGHVRSSTLLVLYSCGEAVEVRVTRERRPNAPGRDRVYLHLLRQCNLDCSIVVRIGDAHEFRTPSPKPLKVIIFHVDLAGEEPDLMVSMTLQYR